jgi:hypothetical protein
MSTLSIFPIEQEFKVDHDHQLLFESDQPWLSAIQWAKISRKSMELMLKDKSSV